MIRAALAAWMVLAVGSAVVSHGQEIAAHTAFRLEAVGVVGVSYHAPRGSWTVVSVGGGPRTVYVDTFGQMIEHRLSRGILRLRLSRRFAEVNCMFVSGAERIGSPPKVSIRASWW